MNVQHILAPVDVDPVADRSLADRLLDDAAALAGKYGAKLTLLYVDGSVTPPVFIVPESTNAAYRAMQDVMHARTSYARRALSALVDRAKQQSGVTAVARIVTVAGSVPEIILDVARDEGADLIAISTHGRRGVKRFFLGSVAERTAHLAHVPVLLLPPR